MPAPGSNLAGCPYALDAENAAPSRAAVDDLELEPARCVGDHEGVGPRGQADLAGAAAEEAAPPSALGPRRQPCRHGCAAVPELAEASQEPVAPRRALQAIDLIRPDGDEDAGTHEFCLNERQLVMRLDDAGAASKCSATQTPIDTGLQPLQVPAHEIAAAGCGATRPELSARVCAEVISVAPLARAAVLDPAAEHEQASELAGREVIGLEAVERDVVITGPGRVAGGTLGLVHAAGLSACLVDVTVRQVLPRNGG